jgi:Tol biopolymer transport system component
LPSFLTDGRHFLYMVTSRASPERNGIFVGSIDGPPEQQEQRRVLATPTSISYVSGPPGQGTVLFLRDGRLMAQSFDEQRREMIGRETVVAEGVDAYFDTVTASASTNALVYRSTPSLELTWFDRQGRPTGSAEDRGQFLNLSLSPDGTKAIVARPNPQVASRRELWLFDFPRQTSARLVTDGEQALWSADGRRVMYDNYSGLYERSLDRNDARRLLPVETGVIQSPTSWSADGRSVLYTISAPKTGSDIWTLSLDGTPTVAPFLQTAAGENQAQFAPGSAGPALVAFTSNESGRDEVYVRPFAGNGLSRMVSRNGGHSPRWSGDGRELFYLSADGRLMSVAIEASKAHEPRQLFSVPSDFSSQDSTALHSHAPWGVAPDGQRFLFATPAQSSVAGFTVVLNWQTGNRAN